MQDAGFKFGMRGAGCGVRDARCGMLDSGCGMRDAGCGIPDSDPDPAGPNDSGRFISPAPGCDAESDVRYDQVGTGSMAIRGYEPEEPAAQCEGMYVSNCNSPLSAGVTVYGHQLHI